MNRSNVKMLLLASCMACVTVLWSQPAAGEGAKPRATTRPATQPAKVNITIGKDTTYITGPLNADGTMNYVAYINAKHSKGVTPENNAAVLMLRALGPEIWPEEVRAKAFEKMGITAPPLNGDYFVTVDQYVDSLPKPPPDSTDEPDEQLDRAMQAPWSAKTLPTIAGWLEANDTPLALAVEATKRPRFYQPLISTSNPPQILDTLSGPWTDHMAVAKALTARTMMKT